MRGRFLRLAALAAVLTLALAGSALAAERTWKGPLAGNWNDEGNWTGNQAPAAGDTAIITAGVTVTVAGDEQADIVKLGDGATLKIGGLAKLTLKGGELSAVGSATVTSEAMGGLTFETANKITVSSGALSLEGGAIEGAAAALALSGGGRLMLNTPFKAANDVTLADGSGLTLHVADALPGVAGGAKTLQGGDGFIAVEADNVFANTLTKLTLTEGNLDLFKKQRNTLETITMTKGTLAVKRPGAAWGGADAKLELEFDGHLNLQGGDVALRTLATFVGSTIEIANGRTLTVKELGADILNAAVTGAGTLAFELADGTTVNAEKEIQAKVKANATATGTTLVLKEGMQGALEVTKNLDTDKFTLEVKDDSSMGSLTVPELGAFVVKVNNGKALNVAKLALDSATLLDVQGGGVSGELAVAAGSVAKAKVTNNARLRVVDPESLKAAAVELDGGVLVLPRAVYPSLTLQVNGHSTLKTDSFAKDAPLTVKKITVAADKTLAFWSPEFGVSLKAGETVVLLRSTEEMAFGNAAAEVDGVPVMGVTTIVPITDAAANKNELILEALKDISVPVLTELDIPKAAPGAAWQGSVKVEGEFRTPAVELLKAYPEGSFTLTSPAPAPTSPLRITGTTTADFVSATLRVKAASLEWPSLFGFVDVVVTAAAGGGETPGGGTPGGDTPTIPSDSWRKQTETDAQGNMTLTLSATLRAASRPTAVTVQSEGLSTVPTAEIYDGTTKVLGAGLPVLRTAAMKDYTLVLNVKTTKAEVDKGALIKSVTVTLADGKKTEILVDKKIRDMPEKPGNGTPDDDKPDDDTPDDDKPKTGSSGGCDAGFGGLALALAAMFLLKKRA